MISVSIFLHTYSSPRFPSLFGEIESEIKGSGDLGIDAYGTSMPTLEEVFLRLGEESEYETVSKQILG